MPQSVPPKVAKALGGSLWFETEEAYVIATDDVVETLDVGSVNRWWTRFCARLEVPDRSICQTCGHPEPVGETEVRLESRHRTETIDVLLFGHAHRPDAPDDPRDIYVLRNIRVEASKHPPDEITDFDDLSNLADARGLGEVSSLVEAVSDDRSGRNPVDVSEFSSSDVDSYLATLSRDLRTPLDAILGYSEMLLKETDGVSSTAADYARRIHLSGSKLLDTISTLEHRIVRERQKRRLAETLRSLSTMLVSSLEFDAVIEQIHDCVAEVIDFDCSRILLPRGDEYVVVSDRGDDDCLKPAETSGRLERRTQLYRRLVDRAPDALLVDEVDASTFEEPDLVYPDCRSWLGVAIGSGDEPRALVVLESSDPDAYDEFDVELLTTLGHQAALALDNAHEYGTLQQRTRFDPLTGVCSREYFFTLLTRALDDATASDDELAVLMIDIDHFKPINDTYGHPVGDRVLRQVAEQISGSLRDEDRVGRYGGEEFIVMLPGADDETGRRVAERIRRTVEETVFEVDDHSLDVTLSAGVSSQLPDGSRSVDELVESADNALYRAKDSGRNTVAGAGD